MNMTNFLRLVPPEGYHAPNGKVDVFSEKNLSFECGCGSIHSVNDSLAILDSGLTNEVVYLCPNNVYIFNLVKATGIFRIKGLKTLATYRAENDEQHNSVMVALESRKKRRSVQPAVSESKSKGGLLENLWAASVMAKLAMQHRFDIDELSKEQQETLKFIILSLKDKQLDKEQSQETINKLAEKYGGLTAALDAYADMFDI